MLSVHVPGHSKKSGFVLCYFDRNLLWAIPLTFTFYFTAKSSNIRSGDGSSKNFKSRSTDLCKGRRRIDIQNACTDLLRR